MPPSPLPGPFLGRHHFAYLRAVAEGVRIEDAARRYLLIEHGAAARSVHRTTTEQAMAIARRRGDGRWRLIGIAISDKGLGPDIPTIDEWAETQGLGEWSEDERRELYMERFGDVSSKATLVRRRQRNERLRQRRLALLRELEVAAAIPATAVDPLSGWLPVDLVEQLQRQGLITLGDLQRLIRRGGRWWKGIRAFGPTKAARLARLTEMLLGEDSTAPARHADLAEGIDELDGRFGRNRSPVEHQGLDAASDQDGIAAWVVARAKSPTTKRQYLREAERFQRFCLFVRGKALSDATAEDCSAYMMFLANIPDTWISRRYAKRGQPGWAPFASQLKPASQQLALDIVNALFEWLAAAKYLRNNPWLLVDRRIGAIDVDEDLRSPLARAFTRDAWNALTDYLRSCPDDVATHRLRWLCTFGQCTGLRATELIRAKRHHLRQNNEGWFICVLGKGRRVGTVPVPSIGIEVTRSYLSARGINFESAPRNTPLLACLAGNEPITYSALYSTFTRFIRRAMRASALPSDERLRALQASAHWLRHTYAKRSAEAGIPMDVLQANMRQSDIRTTSLYYEAEVKRRQRLTEEAFSKT